MRKNDSMRMYAVFGVVVLVASVIGWKLFMVSYVRHTLYSQTAQAQSENISNVMVRGNIYAQDPATTDGTYLLATNKKFAVAYAIPSSVTEPVLAAEKLHIVLGVETSALLKVLNAKSSGTKVLARRLTEQQVTAVKALGIKGIGVQYETDRYYPSGSLLATVLGFLGYGSNGREGQYGIEGYFNEELSGTVDVTKESSGNFFSKLMTPSSHSIDAPRPADVVLTIDRNIQAYAEERLEAVLAQWHASGGTVIIEEPKTGKILAMVDRPDFDPNNYSAANPSAYINRGVQSIFEPGSSFKPITMAAGLDMGKVTPATTYTDPGVIDIGGFKIHNFDNASHGTVSMTTVLEKSLNTGVAFVEGLLGQDNFLNYVVNFGFGQQTGIDLPGESNGNIANLYSGRQINFVTASFGQGLAVTPIQLISAYAALANGGKLMKPYVVDHVRYEGGKTEVTQPEVVAIPISEKTSDKIKTMLVSVVDNGFDKARIKGYDIAGKTGTAQIPDGKGGYEEGTFIHDFLGFAPASDPRFVILIKMDRPQGITFAADSLSPTFRELAQFLINYYNIPPTR